MIQSFLGLFVPLLIIMDPVGNLPLFLAMTQELERAVQVRVAALACSIAGIILLVFGLFGEAILSFLHISLPAFQLAGGFIFFIYALQMFQLISPNLKSSPEEEAESLRKTHIALVPLATPLLAGPGAITLVLMWQQDTSRHLPLWLLACAVLTACTSVFAVFALAPWVRQALGVTGIGVVTRLTGLLLAVIAMQFVIDGLTRVLR
ncbi:MAG: MarC family protein [Methylohalobius sp.]|nr:MarC family protein [Methylohalobius sp.]